jgi:hypothetical protein
MAYSIAGVVATRAGSRMTIVAKTFATAVEMIATWKACFYLTLSTDGNWVSGSPIRKCPGDRYVDS